METDVLLGIFAQQATVVRVTHMPFWAVWGGQENVYKVNCYQSLLHRKLALLLGLNGKLTVNLLYVSKSSKMCFAPAISGFDRNLH